MALDLANRTHEPSPALFLLPVKGDRPGAQDHQHHQAPNHRQRLEKVKLFEVVQVFGRGVHKEVVEVPVLGVGVAGQQGGAAGSAHGSLRPPSPPPPPPPPPARRPTTSPGPRGGSRSQPRATATATVTVTVTVTVTGTATQHRTTPCVFSAKRREAPPCAARRRRVRQLTCSPRTGT